jgi:hypothetical protein
MKQLHLTFFVFLLANTISAQTRTERSLPAEIANTVAQTPPTALTPAQKRRLEVLNVLMAGIDRLGAGDSHAFMETQSLAKAKDSLKRNDIAGAEEFLTALIPFDPNTANWHLDAAQRWLTVANDLSRQADRAQVPVAVAQAVHNAGQSEALARQNGDTRAEAAAKTTAGFIHERYTGNPVSAIAAYRAALTLNPNDQPTREALSRMERSFTVLQARFRTRK